MAINTSSFAKFLWPGVKRGFGITYNEWNELYNKVFEINKSSLAFEEDVSLVGFGLAQEKSEGSNIQYDDASQGFVWRYNHTTMALGFQITQEAFDDMLGEAQAFKRGKALGYSMRQTKEVRGFNMLNRAFTATYTFGDGKELCADDLPNKSGGTWRNELSTAADLSEASVEQALVDIGGFTDDRGLKIHIMSKMLVVPVALQFEAHRLLNSVLQPGSANNDTNAIKGMGMFPEGALVSPYLTDTDAWFITTNCPSGLICYERQPMKLDVDNSFDNGNAKFKAVERYSFGVSDKRGIFGSPGAA